jgi:oligopeptide transport system substrate-binding protein
LARAASLPRYDPRIARDVLAGRLPQLDFAIAGMWRSSSSAALAIAAQWQAAGVRTMLRSYSTGAFWGPRSAGGILQGGRFDVALTSWSPTLDPDRSYLFGCAALPPAGGNAGGYCSPAYDAAQARGAAAYDPRTRRDAYREAARVLARDVPVIPLGFERSAYAISSRFEGFKPNVLGRDYWNAWEWHLRSGATSP